MDFVVKEHTSVREARFFAELKRCNVYKAAIAYGVVAWLLMQIVSADAVAPNFKRRALIVWFSFAALL
jgi:hypothetical protein